MFTLNKIKTIGKLLNTKMETLNKFWEAGKSEELI